MAASTQTIQKMYIAYFGRPADTIGLQYWADKTEAQIIAGFSASSESQALFGNQGSAAKVNAIYNNLFARDAEPAGLQYWVQKLESGQVSQAEAMYTILNNAGAGDATAVANKLAAAEAFTAQIDTTPEILGYTGANAAQSAREWLPRLMPTLPAWMPPRRRLRLLWLQLQVLRLVIAARLSRSLQVLTPSLALPAMTLSMP